MGTLTHLVINIFVDRHQQAIMLAKASEKQIVRHTALAKSSGPILRLPVRHVRVG